MTEVGLKKDKELVLTEKERKQIEDKVESVMNSDDGFGEVRIIIRNRAIHRTITSEEEMFTKELE